MSLHVKHISRMFRRIPLWTGLLPLMCFIILAVWKIPQWQANSIPEIVTGTQGAVTPSAVERAELEDSYRGTLVQAFGGLFFLITASLTWKNIQLSEDKQVTERFSKAVEMLSETKKLESRLGGIYLLERISKDSPEDYSTVMEVLTAFIRERSFLQDENHGTFVSDTLTTQEKAIEELPTDIKAALTVIVRRDRKKAKLCEPINLEAANLSRAFFRKAYLHRANFTRANLRGANFDRADLSRSGIEQADLRRAFLNDVNLSKAFLNSSNLSDASLIRADLKETWISCANLSGANLKGADLAGANLGGANLEGADLQDANFEGTTITQEQLDQAILCRTKLPEGIDINPSRDCPTIEVEQSE